jgi:glutathione S-transferase
MYQVVGSAKNRSLRVLWMLEEIGQPYTLIAADPRSETAITLSPSGKLPALIDGEATITDSTAIMTYLADKHGAFTAPAGTLARAQQDSVTQFLLDEFDAVLWTAARHSFVLPQEMRLPAIKTSLKWEYARSLMRLSARLNGPFLMGDMPSIPDIIAAHCLNWGHNAGFAAPDAALTDFAARMRNRPAYLRAMG